jgi:dipeptidase
MAERAKSSREAIRIAGKLIDRFGYADSGRSYMIADADEGWVMAVVNGKHWVAARIPDDEIAIIPNYYTIGEIDLSDTTNFLGSPDIISYAIKRGWYNPEEDGAFNFSKAYARPRSRTYPGNVHRIWRGVNLVSGQNYSMEDDFPFSVKRQDKISYQQVMDILRDHYVGTELDHSNNYALGSPYNFNGTTICSKATQYSIVAQLRNWMPAEIRARIWISILRPDVQVYVPWYVNVENTPEQYRSYPWDSAIMYQFNPPQKIFDPSSKHTYWVSQQLADNVDKNYKELMSMVRKTWDAVEEEEAKKINTLEKKAISPENPDPRDTYKQLADYSLHMANLTYKKAKKLVKKTKKIKK